MDKINCKAKLYLDDRTDAQEIEALNAAEIDFTFLNNDHDFVEGLYGKVAANTSNEWLLILTSDEIPTTEMLIATAELIDGLSKDVNCAAFARRWVYREPGGDLKHSTAPFIGDDYQPRLIRHKDVFFRPIVHTGGFDIDPQRQKMIPREFPVYHFDWLVHSKSLRQRKLAFYDRILPGAAQSFAKWYLPENCLQEHAMQSVSEKDVIDFSNTLDTEDHGAWVDKLAIKYNYPR
ncbi:hypothetical protein [Methylobacterium sp. E-066]|uniref:hypothetical protein n=1 Tax=Methylobacterium sp. E-066 TaxID=2836584 RepID=UPI001FBA8FCA|nr:hypothetical protein [Methylobacterium sp. E-066]MCJ2143453.1 hypothetical protein [Methylobacterium sp. E-066]